MSSIYSTLTSRSGLPTTILIVSIPLCALEYKRWDLGGSLCIWFGLLALVALMLPQELTRILDMIQKSRGPEITADDGPFKVQCSCPSRFLLICYLSHEVLAPNQKRHLSYIFPTISACMYCLKETHVF
jgi:hypothetical protein